MIQYTKSAWGWELEPRDQLGSSFSGREARRHRRFNLEVEIKIDSKTSGVLTGRTVDISESGISAMLKIEVPVGEMVELQFKLPNGPVSVYAVVRHRNAFRYGFQFVETPASRNMVLEACERLSAQQS
ncbi:MAG TPA: PilZ domain-containing protein [Candidatus Sulfotelmatobacter sp.]